MSSNPADLLPQTRIRLAALELFGEQGFEKTTIRQIATRAGVSPGLVIHHFGSKHDLRAACDDWAIEAIGQEKVMLTLGEQPGLRDYVREHPEYLAITDYLVTGLREGGAIADRIYDRMVEITRDMVSVAEEAGLMHLPDDREGALAFLVASSLGMLMLAPQFARQLGGLDFSDPEVIERYGLVAAEVFTRGVFSEDYLAALQASNPRTTEE